MPKYGSNAEKQAAYRQRRAKGLRKGTTPAPNETPKAPAKGAALNPGYIVIPANEPILTADSARELAKLLAAGLPQLTAMAYVAPDYAKTCGKYQRPRWRERWMNDPLLLDAVRALNGAAWVDLDPKRRLDIALDKHYAELAYFLYHHDFEKLHDEDLDKAKLARMALVEKLAEGKAGDEAPWQRFMRELLADKVKGHVPAQLLASDVGEVKEAMPVPAKTRKHDES